MQLKEEKSERIFSMAPHIQKKGYFDPGPHFILCQSKNAYYHKTHKRRGQTEEERESHEERKRAGERERVCVSVRDVKTSSLIIS